jgi:hypothetical protein
MRRSCFWIVSAFLVALTAGVWADTVVVKPSNLSQTGWVIAHREGNEVRIADGSSKPAEAVAQFISGYKAPPAGTGSLRIYVGSGEADPLPKIYVGTNRYAGVRLDQITQFKFWACPRWWCYKGAQPVTVEIATSKGGNLRLCTFYPWGFEPSGYYAKGVWREYDLMTSGGSWEITNVDAADRKGNWAWLVGHYPGATIIAPPAQDWPSGTISGTGLNIKIGAGQAVEMNHNGGAWWRESSGCNACVDKLTIGYTDSTGKEVVTTYDFEAD